MTLPQIPDALIVRRNAHGLNHYFTAGQMVGYGRDCAQAALAAKDAEIATLDQSESQLIGERDAAQEYGTKLADAVSAFFRVPVGEYSNMNDPRDEALAVLEGAYITDSDQDRQITALTAERDALRILAQRYRWINAVYTVKNGFPAVDRGMAQGYGLDEAIDAAMTKEAK